MVRSSCGQIFAGFVIQKGVKLRCLLPPICTAFMKMPKGKVMPEFAIDTPGGVKLPDVVWCSLNFLRTRSLKKSPFTDSSELFVEIVSESDTREEMREKMQLYFDKGAKEV